MAYKRVVIINVAGLGLEHFKMREKMPAIASLQDRGRLTAMKTVFPAVTLPVQASLTTGVFPETHGVVANGFYSRDTFSAAFWEQASSLVQAERIWDRLKKKNPSSRTALLFFQNSLYASADVVITPKPFHTEEGLLPWCYSKPVGLYEQIAQKLGEFNLFNYWGPMASIESSRWIAKASVEVLAREAPDLMFVYLPHLDYCSQTHAPSDPKIGENLSLVDGEVGRIVQGLKDLGIYDETLIVLLSEYSFSEVKADIPVNRLLRRAGLLEVRTIKDREYVDLELSQAFAMVDHQVAHIYVKPGSLPAARKVVEKIDGIDFVLDAEQQKKYRAGHGRAGDLIAVSARDRWFSYYWWEELSKAPGFAHQVDIHRKPGYDPLELCLEPGTRQISLDTSRIKGSHGYPPVDQRDLVPLLLCGEGADRISLPDEMCVTDLPGLVEDVLLL